MSREKGETPLGSLDPESVECLTRHPWPGNIREIENLVKYFLTLTHGDTIHLRDLPPPYRGGQDTAMHGHEAPPALESEAKAQTAVPSPEAGQSMRLMEKTYVLSLLEKTRWNVTSAARLAGIKRTTFTYRMKKLGISRKLDNKHS